MLNWIWVAMLSIAVMCGALTDRLADVTKASVVSAGAAVELAIGLVGVMALWLGLMKVLQRGGLLGVVMRGLAPVTRRLFPEVPPDHPAMTMIVLNMTSNMLGLTNAATPFGIKAMIELDKLNAQKGTATNSMALLLAINTSNIALLPTGMIALRASLDSQVPGSILVPTLLATTCSTLVAILVARLAAPWFPMPQPESHPADLNRSEVEVPDTREAEATIEARGVDATPAGRWTAFVLLILILGALAFAALRELNAGADPVSLFQKVASEWLLALLVVGIVLFGLGTGVKVYDTVVEAGKEGFDVALRIIPFLVAMLVAVGMLRASGAIDLMVSGLSPLTSVVGMPAEVVPMALIRSLSGSGAFGVASELMTTHGPDSLLGTIASVMQGSSDTTFYVLAVYYGAIAVKNTRHTLVACLMADIAGALAAVWVTRLLFVPVVL